MHSITRNLAPEYRPLLADADGLFFGFFDCLPRSTPAPERIRGDALAVLGLLIRSRDPDGWTTPISRAEIAHFFRHEWPAGRTYRLVDDLLRRRFVEAREYVIHRGSGWRTWTRFRVRSRSERAADVIARRRRHR